jgi:hypothetical protein
MGNTDTQAMERAEANQHDYMLAIVMSEHWSGIVIHIRLHIEH